MSIKKSVLTIAAAGALTAAAVPALALENEFHGAFAVQGVNSNYRTGGGTGYLDFSKDPAVTKNFVEQRARIFYSAKANDNLKLVTGFELDSTWGKSSYAVGRANDGGALGTDSVNLETKWVYLDFNDPYTGANFKAGIQGLNDAYKGVFVGGGADAAGIQVSKAFGPATATVGWFRLDDRSDAAATFSNGKQTRDLFLLDGKYAVTKDLKVGASYYFLNDDNAASTAAQSIYANPADGKVAAFAAGTKADYNVHVLGVNAAANVGPATVDGFFLYEFGSLDSFGALADASKGTGLHVNAFAANVGAKVKVGPGTAKASALYVSGGSNAFVNINNTTSAAFSENALGGAMGNMYLLARNSLYSTNDQFVIYESSNRGQGILGGSVGFDSKITDKTFAGFNVAAAAVAKRTGLDKGGKFQGTELNGEIGYKVFDSLTASLQGAVVVLGDYYNHAIVDKNTGESFKPDNPYLGRIVFNYIF